MDGFNRKAGQGAIARHLRSILALCTFAVPLAAFSSGCDAGGAANEKVAQADQALKACVTLPATGDAMVTLRPKAQTWGSHPALRVGGNDESLVKFDLSSIPAEASVDSATLKLYASSVTGTNAVNIHAADNAWNEATVSYEGFNQQFETTTSAILDPNVATTYKTADVKGLVNRWRSGAKANNGMLLTRDGNDKAQFTSRDGTAGFGPTLTVCYTLIEDLCAAGPCAHGACTNGDPTYTCACDPGWTGTNCDINIDECAGNPCQNNGACTDGVNSYSCACVPGYSGANCETEIDECAANPCQHGICTDKINAYSCACDPGYAGTNCEIDIDECAGNPCENGAACTDGVNSYSCACVPGYTGANCEINIDECAATPCANGDCVDGVNAYTCACLPGWAGGNCEINIDECAGDPCLNGGTCNDGIFSYTCSCAPGYEGTNCEVDINDCASAPCQNGGLCVDGVNSYTCQCAMGWTGADCDQPLGATCPCDPGFTAVKNTVLSQPGVSACIQQPGYYVILGSGTGSGGYTGFGVADTANYGSNACSAVDAVSGIFQNVEGLTDEEYAACLALMPESCPPLDPCISDPCAGNAICTPSADALSYTCACEPGWSGDNCDQLDPSVTCPCEPQFSSVRDTVAAFPSVTNCVLDGPHNVLDEYDASTGLYYGVVTNSATSHDPDNYCQVIDSAQGVNIKHGHIGSAEVAACNALLPATCPPPDPCLNAPCQNGGTCTSSPDHSSYTCDCVDGWTGQSCDQPPTCPCEPDFSAVLGTVLAYPESLPTCVIAPEAAQLGYYVGNQSFAVTVFDSGIAGPTPVCAAVDDANGIFTVVGDLSTAQFNACMAMIPTSCPPADPCLVNPCQNGATCTASPDRLSYTCACSGDWTGQNCDVQATCPCEPAFSALRDQMMAFPSLDACDIGPDVNPNVLYTYTGGWVYVLAAQYEYEEGPNGCIVSDGAQDNYVEVYGISNAEVAACRALMPTSCTPPQ